MQLVKLFFEKAEAAKGYLCQLLGGAAVVLRKGYWEVVVAGCNLCFRWQYTLCCHCRSLSCIKLVMRGEKTLVVTQCIKEGEGD